MKYAFAISVLLPAVVACSSAPATSTSPSAANGVGTDSTTLPVKGEYILALERYTDANAESVEQLRTRLFGQANPNRHVAYAAFETVGPCTYSARDQDPPKLEVPNDVPSHLDVGTITVEGGQLPGGSLSCQPANTSDTPVEIPNLRAFEGGETFSFHAAGGSLPGIDRMDVVAPHDVEVTMPSPVGDALPELDRAVDLQVKWSGGSEGADQLVYATILAYDMESKLRKTVSCTFLASDGQGTFPAALLAHLPITNDATRQKSWVTVTTSSETTRRVGEWNYVAIVGGEVNVWETVVNH